MLLGILISYVLAYLIGSIACAIIIPKLYKRGDPRQQGSGNAGATNVLRYAGKNTAAFVLLGDALKGIIAMLIGRAFGLHGVLLAFVLLFVVVGHIFPIYFQFKGGKGVATFMGAMLILSFWIAVIAILLWIIMAIAMRYASLASLIAVISAPVFIVFIGNRTFFVPVLMAAVIIIWKHTPNIQKLRQRQESQISFVS